MAEMIQFPVFAQEELYTNDLNAGARSTRMHCPRSDENMKSTEGANPTGTRAEN